MLTLTALPDTLTVDDAAAQIALIAPTLGITREPPDVRTLRLWRAKKQLTIEGRRFTRRNVFEVLVVLRLRQDGLTHQNAVKRTLALDEDRLRLMLADVPELTPAQRDIESLITIKLLATGILEQYRLARDGWVVGHTELNKTGEGAMPIPLRQAMARLSRNYFESDQEDLASSVHQLLSLCCLPFGQWAPSALGRLEQYRDAVLIDATYRVPSEDCETIAEEADGANLENLVERHLHAGLSATLKKPGLDADVGYTVIRQFIGRHPMATAGELRQIYSNNPELNTEAVSFVWSLYSPVHASRVRGKAAPRCCHCNGLVDTEGYCTLAGCREDATCCSKISIPVDQAYVARPDVCKYWADPAREELRLYDALQKIDRLRDHVFLYPHSDWCDVSLDEQIGIDVKDYRDPARLAQRLNRSIGHLEYYPERILAIAKRRWKLPFYRDRLLEHLSPARRSQLLVMSVDDAILHVQSLYGGEQDAK